MSESDDELKERVAGAVRKVRERARTEPAARGELPPYAGPSEPGSRLSTLPQAAPPEAASSPDRSLLNQRWDVSETLDAPLRGRLGRLLSPLRKPLQRVLRFALGPLVERQKEFNSAQVRFDNEMVQYLDERIDRLTAHYDQVLGLHGKRMEEIDERHLILQQELIRHVHDLVKRIEFVFETAEQNHLYLEGLLREVREDVRRLADRMDGRPRGEEKR